MPLASPLEPPPRPGRDHGPFSGWTGCKWPYVPRARDLMATLARPRPPAGAGSAPNLRSSRSPSLARSPLCRLSPLRRSTRARCVWLLLVRKQRIPTSFPPHSPCRRLTTAGFAWGGGCRDRSRRTVTVTVLQLQLESEQLVKRGQLRVRTSSFGLALPPPRIRTEQHLCLQFASKIAHNTTRLCQSARSALPPTASGQSATEKVSGQQIQGGSAAHCAQL